MALARDNLVFCPPDKVNPLSPTSVSSLSAHSLISSFKQQISIAF